MRRRPKIRNRGTWAEIDGADRQVRCPECGGSRWRVRLPTSTDGPVARICCDCRHAIIDPLPDRGATPEIVQETDTRSGA